MIKGVDVSSYQPADYSTRGLDFVFIKITEGTSYTNPKWVRQRQTARDAGLVTGFYHFVRDGSMTAQADYFLSKINLVKGDILALDWEDGAVSGADKDAWIRYVQRKRPHTRVLLYCNVDFWLNRDTTSFAGDGLWIAHYNGRPGKPGIKAPWRFHQYTSDPIDTNLGDFAGRSALRAWAGGATQEEDDDMPIRTSLGHTKDQTVAWNEWTAVQWDAEYADPGRSHTAGSHPGYVPSTSSWADFNGRLALEGMAPGDQLQVRYEVHEWRGGESVGVWTEIIADHMATPGKQFVSLPWSKDLDDGEHVYVAVKPIPADGRADAPAPKVTSGRWTVRQDR